jgi:hypothetical protein
MAKIYGHTANSIVPQSDFDAGQNENNGWEATQSFNIKKGDLDSQSIQTAFPLGARLRTLDPNCDVFFSGLKISKILAISNIEGGWTRITCRFVGFGNSGETAGSSTGEPTPAPTFSKRGVLIDAPLDEHPKWKALGDADKFALGLLIKGDAVSSPDFTGVGSYSESGTWAAWEGESGPIALVEDALEFAKRIAQGHTTYKQATYEYTHRWESNLGVSVQKMNDLGKISEPTGEPPAPGTGRNWLLAGVNEEQYGSGDYRFTNELVYLLSDEGGHDEFLQSP